MALGDNDINHSNVSTELGISVGTDRDQTSLTRHASINKYSFFRSGSISPNVTTKLVELTAPSSDDLLGDFRRYDQSAGTPRAATDYTQNWGPSGTTMTVTLVTYIEELNIKELNGSATHFGVDFYLSSSDRTNQINKHHSKAIAISFSAVSPPPGHTNNQTQKPSSTSQALVISDVPTAGLSDDDVLYCDTYLSNSGLTSEYVRFDDTYTDVTTHKYTNPFVDAYGPNYSPVPAGYTFVSIAVTNSSSNNSAVDFTESNGSTTYGTFYWFVYGLKAGTYYRIGSSNVTVQLRIPGGTDTQIFNSSLNAAGASSNQSSSGTLSTSQSWVWDDEADLVITANDWSTITEYALPGVP